GAVKTFRLLTKAIGLPIGKCVLDLSGQNSIVLPAASRRPGPSFRFTYCQWAPSSVRRRRCFCVLKAYREGRAQLPRWPPACGCRIALRCTLTVAFDKL